MSKLINLVGQRFGFWVVQNQGDKNKNGKIQWNCLCECGIIKSVSANSLRTGNSTSCGCNHTPNLVNEKFDQLKVLALSNKSKTRRHWLCQCDCGVTIVVNTNQLRAKTITSCGHEIKNKKIQCWNVLLKY